MISKEMDQSTGLTSHNGQRESLKGPLTSKLEYFVGKLVIFLPPMTPAVLIPSFKLLTAIARKRLKLFGTL
jgi:hypothetical protein